MEDVIVTAEEVQNKLNSPQQTSYYPEKNDNDMIRTEDKPKKWEHIAIRPNTFEEFKKLKHGSCDVFVKDLMEIYKKNYGL